MNDNFKKELRTRIKKERADIKINEKKQWDIEISDNLIKSGILDNCKLVLIYLSTEIEVGTVDIIEYCLNNSISVAIPKCVGPHKMKFYLYNRSTKLEKSKYGILEPLEDDENTVKNYKSAVCIVPGLSFDKNGYRLGYGGGFYDNLIINNPELITVGVCYSCHISENLPVGKYDKKVKYIITEKGMEVCNGQQT